MVVRLFHPWVGGTERQAFKLAKELIAQGYSVRVVTGRWFRGTARSEVLDGVPVTRHGTLFEFFGIRGLRKFGGYLYMLTLGWHLVRTRKTYDLIHVHGLNYHAGVAAIFGRWLGKPTIVKLANSGMASDIDRMRQGRQLAGSRVLLPATLRCDRFVALSPVIEAELRAAGVDRRRILSIPNGVDVTRSADVRPRVGNVLQVMFVGRLHHQKGADVLVEACRILAERGGRPIRVRIVGDGPERSEVERLVLRYGLGSVVTFVGQIDDPRTELERADVFVLPSRAEGMSNALLEAMAESKAIIATAVSGSFELIEHGRTGLLVPPADPDALADALERLVQDPEECASLAKAAGNFVREHNAMTIVAHRYADLYLELVEPADHAARASIERGPTAIAPNHISAVRRPSE